MEELGNENVRADVSEITFVFCKFTLLVHLC